MAKDNKPTKGKSPNGGETINRSSPRFFLLAATMAVSVAVAFFAATATANADPIVRPYAIAVALALAILLMLFGWIDASKASKGLLGSTIALLPKLLQWGVQTSGKALLVGLFFIGVAGASVWYGPSAIITQTAQCDEAVELEFSIRPGKLKCDGAFTRRVWTLPFENTSLTKLGCFDHRANRWEGSYTHNGVSHCGPRPHNAMFVTNGIKLPDHDPITVSGKRLVSSMARLRAGLEAANLPDRKVKDRLLFATWNIRQLGRGANNPNGRLDESYAYIAEVISHFDIVAIQEIHSDFGLERVLELLGSDYKARKSFVSPGTAGHLQRMGFIYDTRKVAFGDVSTTLLFESVENSTSTTGQPLRPPFLTKFIVNERNLFTITAHAYHGRSSGEKFQRRLRELKQMAKGLNSTFKRNFPNEPIIFAGDMNVSKPDGPEMAILLENGFSSPKELRELPTDLSNRRPYDQILIRTANAAKMPIGRYGVFKPTDFVFRLEDEPEYRIETQKLYANIGAELRRHQQSYRFYRTHQISDHHLKWAEFQVDW